MTIRPIAREELDAFAALDPATPDLAETIRALWADGSGRPGWTLVAEDADAPLGRAAFFTEPLGCGLDLLEGRVAGLWLAEGVPPAVGSDLLDEVARLASGVTPFIERRLNPELHRDVPFWRIVLEGAGYSLFHEKEGFAWTDDGGELPEPHRLMFRSLAEVGRSAYAAAMAVTIPGTLDRNDRFYVETCGPAAWGTEMVGAAGPSDEPAWLLASEPDGALAGYVGVGRFDGDVGTISHIGVVPDRRGRGYVNELLRAANRAARARGYRSMLSDVDTENAPMLAAMERNGHRRGARPWHVWAYRRAVAG
ncbi:MAG TPA: GNAT family N-acetyltransferase [Candidatus Limnocylindria bacterium]